MKRVLIFFILILMAFIFDRSIAGEIPRAKRLTGNEVKRTVMVVDQRKKQLGIVDRAKVVKKKVSNEPVLLNIQDLKKGQDALIAGQAALKKDQDVMKADQEKIKADVGDLKKTK